MRRKTKSVLKVSAPLNQGAHNLPWCTVGAKAGSRLRLQPAHFSTLTPTENGVYVTWCCFLARFSSWYLTHLLHQNVSLSLTVISSPAAENTYY